MGNKNKPLLIALLTLLSTLILSGCSERYPIQPKTDIKGKFVFRSFRGPNFRDPKDAWAGYILENRKLKLLEKNIGCPRWSPDGRLIAYVTKDGIAIYNTLTQQREIIRKSNGVEMVAWSHDGKNLIFTTRIGINKEANTKLYVYLLETKTDTLIKDFELGWHIIELSVSKDNKILFYASPEKGIHIIDFNGNMKLLRKSAMDSSWFPDGQHIGFFTNTGDDGKRINDMFGAYSKMKIETEESIVVRMLTSSDKYRKLSPDGKYLYYSKSYGRDGRYIVISPLEKPEIEIPITKPVEIGRGYSQDLDADWYQGN